MTEGRTDRNCSNTEDSLYFLNGTIKMEIFRWKNTVLTKHITDKAQNNFLKFYLFLTYHGNL